MTKENKNKSKESVLPFHKGEMEIQRRSGADEKLKEMAKKAITAYLPTQHQYFLSRLPFVFIGAQDENKYIWSSILCGSPGFIKAEDQHYLRINSFFTEHDPLFKAIKKNTEVGLLGIDFKTRRRNRVNTIVESLDDKGLRLQVKQCYGNCPKYIQTANLTKCENQRISTANFFDQFDLSHINFIHTTDRLFISSAFSDDEESNNRGVDTSHRGGMPGFVKVIDNLTLLIPDYIGNNFFNTLGNISIDPRVGLHFLGGKNGYRMMLTGTAETIWEEDENLPFNGVDRMIRFTLIKGIELFDSIPYEWKHESYSPFSQAYLPED